MRGGRGVVRYGVFKARGCWLVIPSFARSLAFEGFDRMFELFDFAAIRVSVDRSVVRFEPA
jgi:hypothetical protein